MRLRSQAFSARRLQASLCYATTACRPTRAPRAVIWPTLPPQCGYAQLSKSARSKTIPRAPVSNVLIFSESEVPPLDFLEEKLGALGLDEPTAEECFRAATVYCSIASHADTLWKTALTKKHGVDLYTLYYLGAMLVAGPPGPSWRLGLHVLSTTSDLDYAPSTLTLMYLLRNTKQDSEARASSMFRAAELKFTKLVAQGDNPDALTLQAGLFEAAGKNEQALALCRKAIAVGKRAGEKFAPAPFTHQKAPDHPHGKENAMFRAPRWNWEASCHAVCGRVLLAQGDRAGAQKAFEVTALELDNAAGYLELGRMLPLDEPLREEYLTRAAISGQRDACALLAETRLGMARQPGVSEKERKDHRKWAEEWYRIAGQVDRAIEVQHGSLI